MDSVESFLSTTGRRPDFIFKDDSYPRYVQHCLAQIECSRFYENKNFREMRTPYEVRPSQNKTSNGARRMILTVHGLFSSSYDFYHLENVFLSEGFIVRHTLLPGHGTDPLKTRQTTYQDWVNSLLRVVDLSLKECDNLYLAGASTGALLSLYVYTLRNQIKGLFLLSPGQAFHYDTPLKPHGICRYVTDIDRLAHHVPYFYDSINLNLIWQYTKLYFKTSIALGKKKTKNIPIFCALSLDDVVVNQNNMLRTLNDFNGQKKIVVFREQSQEEIVEEEKGIVYRNAYEGKVTGVSHTGILFPETDPHVGIYSSYAEENREHFMGEPTSKNLKRYDTHLITYNPQYDAMVSHLSNFIRQLEPSREML